uniref:Uncharacterized protein n=1 Tax=Rhizophora mucronata TaxID=61149 RepID=A0A2P2PN22_RHIMU
MQHKSAIYVTIHLDVLKLLKISKCPSPLLLTSYLIYKQM